MPTARARHMITETEEIASAIEVAAKAWPDSESERAELLRRLIGEGAEHISRELERVRVQRLAAVNRSAGSLDGLWPDGWRATRDDEWPT